MKTFRKEPTHYCPQQLWDDFDLEALLNRPTARLSPEKLPTHIRGQCVLLTGAAGSIGSELALQLIRMQPKHLYLLDQSESGLYYLDLRIKQLESRCNYGLLVANICDTLRMEGIFEHIKPEMVFHAAAYKHVPLMEEHPYEAIQTNVMGTKILADLSIQYDVTDFLFVSTDKAVNPANVMGATKKYAEQYLQALQATYSHKTRFIITRFGNVMGSVGSVIPLFLKQIKEGGPITITHPDMYRYFMTIPEACQLVLESSAMAEAGQIYMFDMGMPVSILRIAQQMILQTGLELEKDIQIKYTGLRPGEKLWEELLNPYETSVTTVHPKIMTVHQRGACVLVDTVSIETLINLAAHHQTKAVLEMLEQQVQGFHAYHPPAVSPPD
ncbi:UDP-N-acetylglucosamine 4,6-dehydratase family protein [Dyadobacter tibetensis]|uniref:UDP-N-acetylglucosamine 4,6-dehydratase family protein n=1 Tax=Dyadobacter tibetensis TaxID=1211851 RepID=UPI00046EA6BA|nr:UDP-N-acetylglucosamine 4,6-dehydratase family protein [Dyadobacter tibetensis]